jgi:hypothetical protein
LHYRKGWPSDQEDIAKHLLIAAKRKRVSAQPQDAKRKRVSAQPQDAKRKRVSAQPQDAKRKRVSAQPQETTGWFSGRARKENHPICVCFGGFATFSW